MRQVAAFRSILPRESCTSHILRQAAFTMLRPFKSREPMISRTSLRVILLGFGCMGACVSAQIPTLLTDKLYRGSGEIDLLTDVSGMDLSDYLSANGGLLLGVDVNENASGPESSTSLGIALQDVTLYLETSAGSYSFTDFYTNTTAEILASGATEASTYHTLFGQGGSSQLTSGTTGFDLSKFDDVLQLENVVFSGEILSAKLVVNLLETEAKAGINESFFDFSGGFEDFALLAPADAAVLDAAAIGIDEASTELVFSTTAPVLSEPSGGTNDPAAPAPAPGAPAPPALLLAAAAALWWWRGRAPSLQTHRAGSS